MRVSLMIGVLSVISGAVVGVALGLAAGHFGGGAGCIVMLLVDVQMSIPERPRGQRVAMAAEELERDPAWGRAPNPFHGWRAPCAHRTEPGSLAPQ